MLSFNKQVKMLQCPGYKSHPCGKLFNSTSPNHERCKPCGIANTKLGVKENRRRLTDKGLCRIHSSTPVASGRRKCQNCLNAAKNNRRYLLSKGVCPYHTSILLAPGKTVCQKCLDGTAIYKLPESIRSLAQQKADETREARINGTYVCPILGRTEKELRHLFPSSSNKSVWEFDHIEDSFRDIISGTANRIIKTFSAEELLKCAIYVRNHEI